MVKVKARTYPGTGITYDREYFANKQTGTKAKNFDATMHEFESVPKTFQFQ